jgi:hypothetical protein
MSNNKLDLLAATERNVHQTGAAPAECLTGIFEKASSHFPTAYWSEIQATFTPVRT